MRYIFCLYCSCYKVSEASNDSSLQEIIQEEDNATRLLEAGYSKSLRAVSLDDRNGIISTLLTFHLFLKVKAVMDQFREGLEVAGLLKFLTTYTDLMRPLFVDESSPLTASKPSSIVEMHRVTQTRNVNCYRTSKRDDGANIFGARQ